MHKHSFFKKAALFLVCGCAFFAFDAAAKNPGKGHAGANTEAESNTGLEAIVGLVDAFVGISAGDAETIRGYMKQDHAKKCPPGLAKKNNGCLPPGQAKKYRMGQPLPADVAWSPLSSDLLGKLRPPRGHFYAMVDQDVLLVSEATKHVVDAVTLLSAVN